MAGIARFPALGSTAAVCVTDEGSLAEAQEAVATVVDEYDRACSRFRADSELTALNASAGRPVSVGPTLLGAVEAALRAAALTDGIVDPTVGRALRLLGYDRDFHLVQERDSTRFRARLARVPGWRDVVVDRAASQVTAPAGVELDLGATAKALCADDAAAAAAAAVAPGCGVLVSLGGDIAVAGVAPAGGWPVRIGDDHAAPLDGQGPVVALWVGGLATSSTTVRRWSAGAASLHHVVDPRTGRSASTTLRTATVVAGSCLDANIASTAALVLGSAAEDWLAARGLAARLVSSEGATRVVAGWPEEAA
jgi:thiamine biosynthesis lipoprotein